MNRSRDVTRPRSLDLIQPRGSCYLPRPASVRTGPREVPSAVDSVPVEAVREAWVVEDRWWTLSPLRRHYFELVLEDGRCAIVFRDLEGGRWFMQRA